MTEYVGTESIAGTMTIEPEDPSGQVLTEEVMMEPVQDLRHFMARRCAYREDQINRAKVVRMQPTSTSNNDLWRHSLSELIHVRSS